MLQIFLSILLSTILLYSCCNIELVKENISSFSNGGGYINDSTFYDEDNFFENIKPGVTFCFYYDNVLGLEYGPNYSDTTITVLSNELITEVAFLDMNQEYQIDSLDQNSDGLSFQSFESVDALLAYLESSKLSLTFDLAYLISLYYEATQLTDVSIKDFLDLLLADGLITSDEYSRLIDDLKTRGFLLDNKLSALAAYLEESSLEIFLNSDSLASFIQKYSLESIIELDLIKRTTVSGKPEIVLSKIVDKEIIWYAGNLNYSIKFKNIGNIPAKDMIIIDSLPIGLEYVGITDCTHSISPELICLKKNYLLIFKFDDIINSDEAGEINFRVNVFD